MCSFLIDVQSHDKYTVKPRFTVPRFNANPDLPRVFLFPRIFLQKFFSEKFYFFWSTLSVEGRFNDFRSDEQGNER